MRFGRLLAVVVLVTICGGLFGGVVGGLIGYAIPTTLDAFFLTKGNTTQTDQAYLARESADSPANAASSERSVQVGVNAESKTFSGAALGGAWGLILGAIIGLILGTVDQILLVLNHWIALRREAAAQPVRTSERRAI